MTLVERRAAENPRSRALHERVSASLPGGLAHDVRRGRPFPLAVARAATGRTRTVKLLGHFHGWHDAAAMGVDPPFDRPASPGIPEGTQESVTVVAADPDAVEQALASGDVAAVVLEPSGAAWRAMPLSPAFLAGLREPRLQEEGLL